MGKKGWTRETYNVLYDWTDKSKRASVRKIFLARGLDDIVARLDASKTLGEWYKITHEAEAAVGPGVVEAVAMQAGRELNKMAAALGRKGGLAKSESKAAACRVNGRMGGRPKKQQ